MIAQVFRKAIDIFSKKYWAIAYSFLLIYFCLAPNGGIAQVASINDKILHIGAFGVFAFLWLLAINNQNKVLLSTFVFGIFIEIVQHLLPSWFHRGFEWLDILADALGILIGTIAVFFLRKYGRH
jgi:VanZ family protein